MAVMAIPHPARLLPLWMPWVVLRTPSRTAGHDGRSRSSGEKLQRDYGNIDRRGGGGGDAD